MAAIHSLLVDALKSSVDMLSKHLADFTDADMLVRPVPGANHATWQIAHCVYYHLMTAKVLAPHVEIMPPATLEFAQSKEGQQSDDASKLPTKAQLLETYERANGVVREAVMQMSEADFGKASPEAFQSFAPTIGSLLNLENVHAAMHLGQIQVIRRKLGKPVLF